MRTTFVKGLVIPVLVAAAAACAAHTSAPDRKTATAEGAPGGWRYVGVPVKKNAVAHYWQLTGDAAPLEAREDYRNGCPAGMLRVSGAMRQGDPRRGTVELLQDSVCDDWMDPPDAFPRRCARFNQTRWEQLVAQLPSRPVEAFCIDAYEYPNQKGANPAIDLTWYEARDLCAAEGKRLCTEDEWTFACEGPQALPYPYGYVRDARVCNINRPWIDYKKFRLSPREAAGPGLEQLWGGEPSGARPECKSVFGVYDLTGNVDEWTSSTRKSGYRSILKGGYWSVVRNRCRPATRAHNEGHEFYQQGFRCCR